MDSIKDMLVREAEDAEARHEAEERGEVEPRPGQRARRQATDPSQVYSVRIPVDRIEQLRLLAVERGVAPTALLRQFVLERLDVESVPATRPTESQRDPDELRIGPSRRARRASIAMSRTEGSNQVGVAL